MLFLFLLILAFMVLIDSMYAESKKTEQMKSLSNIEGITPDEIIRILNETKHHPI